MANSLVVDFLCGFHGEQVVAAANMKSAKRRLVGLDLPI
jgi:hypothetical protein